MRQHFFYLFLLIISIGAAAQNVGVGTSNPPSKLTTVGTASNPSIPGATSTGVLRVGIGTNNDEGIDFGKSETHPYSGWVQSGFNGTTADPLSLQPLGGSVGIGVFAPNASAALEVTSTTRGFLPPSMTLAQRDAIASPAEGLIITCTDCGTKGLHQYINGAWQAVTSSNTGNYGTVVNPVTGKVWLDRNLGATQVATSPTDAASYGDLYQWGRNADGHQIRTSGITTTLSSSFFTSNGLFVTNSTSPYNWLSPAETHMWSGTTAENNPCPSGFRIPTAAEWEQERLTWSSNDANGAFNSPLKLPLAGSRSLVDGLLSGVGTHGIYWSSTVTSTFAYELNYYSSNATILTSNRATGGTVRCIQD